MSIVNVLPITSLKPGRRVYANETLLPAGTAGLTSESLAMAHQIRAVDKRRLGRSTGILTDAVLRRQVEKTLRLQLGL